MKRIKTVIMPIEKASAFDIKINALLAEGWTLIKREVKTAADFPSEAFHIPIVQVLYAELEHDRIEKYEEITL